MSFAKKESKPKVKKKCLAITARIECSKCDADISTGFNFNANFCPSICHTWFNECKNEFIDPYSVASKSASPFCKADSMICSKISDIVNSALDFCKFMGHNVYQES